MPARPQTAPDTGLWPLLAPVAPTLAGTLTPQAPLARYTWFAAGGAGEVLFLPADADELKAVLAIVPRQTPITVLGLGSNVIIRDGGVPGLVIRLGGRNFARARHDAQAHILEVGAAMPVKRLADYAALEAVAAPHALEGFAFYAGIPGSIGGAIFMNAGAHGTETKDVLLSAHGLDRFGKPVVIEPQTMGYRNGHVAEGVVITHALYKAKIGARAAVLDAMAQVVRHREASQPIREKTGGSTFKNPIGHKAWQLIDAAGCRGLRIGDAQVSPLHCNFLINCGQASAHDIETLGEAVRAQVLAKSGINLEWEIKRLGFDAGP